ncbi:hypothetical protein Tco_0953952 [Tanacetum coccineum]|uniref:Uncharacterized protein n=1 Tax=Tanacetum coccineum TaxID=301880 RepID=A0ABQ5E1E6_9ASTR
MNLVMKKAFDFPRVKTKKYRHGKLEDFNEFFKRRGRFERQPCDKIRSFQRNRDEREQERAKENVFRLDSGEEEEEKIKDDTCLMAQASSEPDEWGSKIMDAQSNDGQPKSFLYIQSHTIEKWISQKDKKPSQMTKLAMELKSTVQNQGQKVQKCQSQSPILKNSNSQT